MPSTDAIVDHIWEKYDKSRSGYLDTMETYEFVRDLTMCVCGHVDENMITKLTVILDKDGDGRVTKDEMKIALQKFFIQS